MKDLKISKELINQVYPVILEALGDSYKVVIIEDTIDFCQNSKVIINYNLLFSSNGEQQFELSLESFAFKCKEWAYEKGFKILDECNSVIVTTLVDREVYIEDSDFKRPYKIDRLFKACEWILNKVNK